MLTQIKNETKLSRLSLYNIGDLINSGYLLICLISWPILIVLKHDLAKQLSYYLYFFSFLFLLDLLHIRSVGKCHVTWSSHMRSVGERERERERESSVFVYRNKQTSAKTRWVSYIVVYYWLHPSCRVELLGLFRIRCGWWRWSSWVFCGLAGYGGDVLELEHISKFCLMWFMLGKGLGICLYKVSEGSICNVG